MAKKPTPQDFLDFTEDFLNESDRAAVILGAAHIDILLYQYLQKALLPTPTSQDELLDSDRALGTFSARINACYRLGLIDTKMCRALHLLRKIRNSFAHEAGATSLSLGAHRDRVRELHLMVAGREAYEAPMAHIAEVLRSKSSDGDVKEASVQFRTMLAGVVARLRFGLEKVRTLDGTGATTLLVEEGTD